MTDAPKTKTTAKERAAEAVAVLERRETKLTMKRSGLEVDIDDLATEIAAVRAQLQYAKANPLLKNIVVVPVDQEGTR